MECAVADIARLEVVLNAGEALALLAAISAYSMLSMVNFAVLLIAVANPGLAHHQRCRALALANYVGGLLAYPLIGVFVGLPRAGEIAALLYFELAILALFVAHRVRRASATEPAVPEARARRG